MTQAGSRRWAVVGLLGASLLLAGCTSGHHKAIASRSPALPMPSPASSPATSSSVAPPSTAQSSSVPPVQGSGSPTAWDVAAAAATLNGYFAALNAAASSGQASALSQARQMTRPSCATCGTNLSALAQIIAAKEHLKGGQIDVSALAQAQGSTDASLLFTLKAAEEAGSIVDASGKTVSSFKATRAYGYQYRLDHIGSSWVIVAGSRTAG